MVYILYNVPPIHISIQDIQLVAKLSNCNYVSDSDSWMVSLQYQYNVKRMNLSGAALVAAGIPNLPLRTTSLLHKLSSPDGWSS
eukprot:g15720.t1